MQLVPRRQLSGKEAAVLLAALNRAPVGELSAEIIKSVSNLQVIGCCPCGCESVYFERAEQPIEECRVADGLGYLATGEEIGILVWASGGQIVHLELYNYDEYPPCLPEPESVCSFEKARRK